MSRCLTQASQLLSAAGMTSIQATCLLGTSISIVADAWLYMCRLAAVQEQTSRQLEELRRQHEVEKGTAEAAWAVAKAETQQQWLSALQNLQQKSADQLAAQVAASSAVSRKLLACSRLETLAACLWLQHSAPQHVSCKIRHPSQLQIDVTSKRFACRCQTLCVCCLYVIVAQQVHAAALSCTKLSM